MDTLKGLAVRTQNYTSIQTTEEIKIIYGYLNIFNYLLGNYVILLLETKQLTLKVQQKFWAFFKLFAFLQDIQKTIKTIKDIKKVESKQMKQNADVDLRQPLLTEELCTMNQ